MRKNRLADHEKILSTATTLFAELGYDHTTNEMIASSAGVPVAAIAENFGNRKQLYITVFQRLQEERQKFLKDVVGGDCLARPGQYHDVLDRLLDYAYEHPEFAALWMQRWLNDAADIDIEEIFALPRIEAARRRAEEIFREDADPELIVWTVSWLIQVFVRRGASGALTRDDPRALARFRRYLHTLMDPFLKEDAADAERPRERSTSPAGRLSGSGSGWFSRAAGRHWFF